MLNSIRLRATFESYYWEDVKDGVVAEDPIERRGWVDPKNPWGSFEYDEPSEIVVGIADAVAFVRDFPGGVWDYSESEAEQDVRTGEWKSVMLHVIDHENTVFELADNDNYK